MELNVRTSVEKVIDLVLYSDYQLFNAFIVLKTHAIKVGYVPIALSTR